MIHYPEVRVDRNVLLRPGITIKTPESAYLGCFLMVPFRMFHTLIIIIVYDQISGNSS